LLTRIKSRRTTMTRLLTGLVAALLLFAATGAFAQEAPGERVVYKKKTVIDLSGAVIEGELTRPESTYVVARKMSRFSNLITLRENFVPELLASPDQL
jgi:hypothetical protein